MMRSEVFWDIPVLILLWKEVNMNYGVLAVCLFFVFYYLKFSCDKLKYLYLKVSKENLNYIKFVFFII